MDTTNYAQDLRQTVQIAAKELMALDNEEASRRPGPDKWSIKEIIGHMIDSACNNHRRFVMAPDKEDMDFEGYAQENWVKIQQYQAADWHGLLRLWEAYNLHISYVMEIIPAEVRQRKHHKHSLQTMAWITVPSDEPVTLDYLMEDYLGHLKHHLQQIRGFISF